MADFNLGAEVSMDVDPLKASKTTLERNLKEINKSLRNQRNEFKKNEASIEQLAERENDLGRAIKLQDGLLKQREKTLQEVQDELKDTNELTDEQRLKLQGASNAVKKAQSQLNNYENELKDVQYATKTFGKSTEDVKRNLGDLRNQVKASTTDFERSSKATEDYENHMKQLNTSINASEKELDQLDDNLKLVAQLKGENSKEAKKLKSEIDKEQLAFKQLQLQLSRTQTEFEDYKNENSETAIAMRKTDEAIDKTKNSISQLSNELKQSNAVFNGSAKESNDYKTHLNELTAAQGRQIRILDELEDEYKQVVATQGQTSQQARALENDIQKQQLAFTTLQNQIQKTTNEYDDFQLENSQTNLTLGEAKRRLEDMSHELQMSSIRFKQSEKTASDYDDKLSHLKATMTQQKAVMEGLDRRYDEVARSQGVNSVAAKNLKEEIMKEAVAFQILQGRIDETSDELAEYQRQQTLVAVSARAWSGAREQMDRIAQTLRNLGEMTQGIVGGLMVSNFSALIPIIGSVVSVGAGLGGMLTAAAGGAIGLGGAYASAAGSIMLFAGMSATALKMLEDGEMRTTAEVVRYQSALTALQNQWKGIIQSNQASIFNTMANGINIARYSLTQLNPFIQRTSNLIAEASAEMYKWVTTSSNAKAVFSMINSVGVNVFGNLLRAGKSAMNGLSNILVQFAPLFTWVGAGIENISAKFDKWANSMSTNNGIAQFIQYTKTNLPIVGSIFSNIFLGIFGLFTAFSAHSHTMLVGLQGVTQGFRQWATELKNTQGFKDFIAYLNANGPKVWNLLKGLTMTIWGLLKGMAPVGAVVLSISSAFFQWTSAMTNAHPIIGKILGIVLTLSGAVLLAAKPILMLRGALLGATGATTLFGNAGAIAAVKTKIAAVAVGIWKGVVSGAQTVALAFMYATKGMTLAQMAQAVQSKIAAAATALWNGITATGTAIANGYRYAIAALTTSQTMNALKTKIASAATVAWTVVTKAAALATRGLGLALRFMTGPIGWIITIVGLLVAGIVHLWKTNEGFRNGVINIWNAIKAAGIAVFGFLKPYITGIWNVIKVATITIWNGIKSTAIAVWNGIKFAVQNPIKALGVALSAIWNGIKTMAVFQWNLLKNGVIAIARALINQAKANFNAFKGALSAIWNAIKGTAIAVWNAIKNGVIAIVRAYVNTVKANFNMLKGAITVIFNGIKNFFINVWNTIKNAVVSRVKSLVSQARNNFNILKSAVTSIFNAIKNFAINVWTNIKNKVVNLVRALYNGARNNFNALKSAVTSIFNAIKNFAVSVWNNIKNKVVSLAKGLYTAVKNHFTNLNNSQRKIFNAVKSFMLSTWGTIKSKVSNLAQGLRDGVVSKFNSMKKGTSDITSKTKSNIISSWEKIKSKLTGLAGGIKDKVTGTFGKMRDGLQSIIGKIGDHINGMVSGVKKGLNKLIDGVNWVGDKLGMGKLPSIKLHTGTESTHTQKFVTNGKLNRDTFATVGDKGKGNGPNGFRHEMIRYPNGKMALTPNRDTTAYLPKGSAVYNGAQTHAMLSNNSIPRFANGTLMNILGGGKKAKKHKHGDNVFGDVKDSVTNGVKNTVGKAVNGTKALVSKAAEKAGQGVGWLSDKVGDIYDFMDKPGKLLDHVLNAFGVNFDFIKGSLPKDMMSGMFKKLKAAAVKTFESWFEDSGGGEGGWVDISKGINFPFSPHGHAPGYPFAGPHMGVDINYRYEKLYSTHSGTATARSGYNGGFGNMISIISGIYEIIYGHLSKLGFSGSKKVNPGTYLGVSGTTGRSNGPHLHYEMRKNGTPIDPMPFLKGQAKGGGKAKSGAKWASTIRKALKMNGLPTSAAYVNAWARQIDSESSGNPNARQGIRDVNSGGNEARGLVQVTPNTFASMKFPGHGNITNPLDNLLAGIHWAKYRYGSNMLGVIGHGHGYAKGTNNARKGIANVFERGGEIMNLRGGEQIIPNDVSIAAIESVINSDIFNRTQTAVYEAISRYAEEIRQKQQQETREQLELKRLSQENTDIKEQNTLLKQILGKMDALLNSNQNIEQSNAQIRDKEYFPDSGEITRMNNKNMALNQQTQLMRG